MRLMHSVTSLAVVLAGLSLTTALMAQGPKLETVFPLAVEFDQPAEFTFTGDAALKQATTFWSPQAELDVGRMEDAKAIRFRITAHPGTTADADDPFLMTGIDLYAVGPKGLGGPIRLSLADPQIVEVLEEESSGRNDTLATAQPLPLNSAVSAVIDPATDVDCFRVALSAGQPLRVWCQSRSLGNDVEPALTIFDPHGREILHDEGDQPEPLLAFRAPLAGDYTIRVHERVWRKPKASGYRLTVTDRPVVLAAFPAVLVRDQEQEVELTGYGLDDATATQQDTSLMEPLTTITTRLAPPLLTPEHDNQAVPASMAAFSVIHYRHPGTVGVVSFSLANESIQIEDDNENQHPQSAPFLTLPADVSGRFLQPRDQDWYRFQARKDQTLWFDAYGERLGQSMDLQIDIHDAQGKLLTSLTDTTAARDRKDPLAAATLDPIGSWKVPAEGEYRFIIRDLYGTSVAGPTRQYRLFVAEAPVGECVMAAGIVNLKPGGSAKLAVYHHGPAAGKETIAVQALDLPEGVTAETIPLPTGGKPGELILKADKDVPAWTGLMRLQAQRGELELPVRATAAWREGSPLPLRQTAGPVLHIIGE